MGTKECPRGSEETRRESRNLSCSPTTREEEERRKSVDNGMMFVSPSIKNTLSLSGFSLLLTGCPLPSSVPSLFSIIINESFSVATCDVLLSVNSSFPILSACRWVSKIKRHTESDTLSVCCHIKVS